MAATLLNELAAVLRSLRRSPGFAALAIATLALGIGANVAIFSIFHSIILSPLPYPDADRLVGFSSHHAAKALVQPALSAADFRDVHAAARSYSALAAFRPDFSSYLPPVGEPVQVISAFVTEEFFPLLAIPPLRGRVFHADEFDGSAARTVVVSSAFWRRQFGSRDDIVGATVTIDNRPTTIIGIMPDYFREPEFVDLWLPFDPQSPENLARDSRYWSTIGRLKPGVDVAAAHAEAAALAAGLAQEYPAINKGWTFSVARLLEQRIGSLRNSLLLLAGAVGLVLLVACVNLANLLLARGLTRLPQSAVRLALGASPGALARGVLFESLWLAFAGGVLGIALASGGLSALAATMPPGLIPRSHAIAVDGTALGFAFALTSLTGFGFGLLPAWQVRRANVNDLLKAGGSRGTAGRRTARVQTALVAAQIAVTLVVLTGATLLARHLLELQAVSPGFDPKGVLAVRVSAGIDSWQDPVALSRYYDRLLAELQRTPGIAAAAVNSSAPLCGISLRYPFWVQGRPRTEGNADEAIFASVTPDLLTTLKLPLRGGRFIEDRDARTTAPVCVINEALARRIFPIEDPLGRRIQILPWLGREYREIVGIVGDTRQDNLSDPPPPQIYVPSQQMPWFFTTILVRIAPGTGVAAVQSALRRADPVLPMTIRSVEENIALTTLQPRLRAWLLGVFAASALALSAFGVYASMAFTVGQRTREIGVRIALGATPREILRWVLARAARVAIAGAGVGLVAALALARLLQGFVPDIGPAEPWLPATLALFLAVIATLAGAQPAWSAARLQPTRALQHE